MKESSSFNRSLIRWSLKEIRHGQLWLVILALALITTSIFALSAVATRMEQAIVNQSKDTLMADTVFISPAPVPESLIVKAEHRGGKTSLMTRFSSMLFGTDSSGGEGMKLVFVKAVDEAFPLRGQLRLSDGKSEHAHVRPGEVWLDPQILTDLGMKIGDSVFIGDLERRITGEIIEEPGLNFNPFRQLPTVLIHQSDVNATGTVTVGSRVQYRLFINGSEQDITWLKSVTTLNPSERWRDVSGSGRSSEIFDNALRYLSLVVVVTVLIAMITLLFTCQNYVVSRKQTVAMLKSLGATRKWVRHWLLVQMALLLCIALFIGVPAGYLLELLLHIPLRGVLPSPLPALGFGPLMTTLTVLLLVAVPGFGISLYQLVHVRAGEVLQSGVSPALSAFMRWGFFLIPLCGVAVFFGKNTFLWVVLAGIALVLMLSAGAGILLLRAFGKFPLSASFKLALRRMSRAPLMTGVQLSALALSLMLFAVLWIVRTDLLADWTGIFPEDAPNVFSINISTGEKDRYLEQLEAMNIEHSPLFPMVRGRLFKINGIDAKVFAGGEQASDIFRREVNFTWAKALPDYNPVVAGQWVPEKGVSVESGVAEDIGIQVGDTLEFRINNQAIIARVNSIRHVDWRDLKPNFYFILSPDLTTNLARSWLLSFRTGKDSVRQMSVLAHEFPTVSLIDLRQITSKIQQILNQIIWAISVLTGMSLFAGLLLIYTLLRLSLDQRRGEMKLYRTLGMSDRRLRWTLWAEFGLLAFTAGMISGVSADGVVAVLVSYGFDLSPRPHFLLWILQPVIACVMVMLVVFHLFHYLNNKSHQQNTFPNSE
ncbi:FtsX-like permease family protein [Vibrio aerogenes CECT 7868]|uniref:FtsX-like permease family protein n=1 Tax=Vibrio aerogenes CECT 7868 TaxID=1216006 RepID=A0A1M5ZVW6_9VIBR|nr:FtsX-like permease family protein [Vibrio aerogenes]SHI28169.1 FtsX-like permease family protein [Vibrio aerogenes CECT 7868]